MKTDEYQRYKRIIIGSCGIGFLLAGLLTYVIH